MSDNGYTSTGFNKYLAEGKLMGTRCLICGARHLPPRAICPTCLSDQVEWLPYSGKGILKAYTVIYIAPTAMLTAGYSRTNPYCTGIVQLEEGPAISAQVLGVDVTQPEKIKIGAPLTATFITRGEGEATRTFLAFTAI